MPEVLVKKLDPVPQASVSNDPCNSSMIMQESDYSQALANLLLDISPLCSAADDASLTVSKGKINSKDGPHHCKEAFNHREKGQVKVGGKDLLLVSFRVISSCMLLIMKWKSCSIGL